MNVGGVNGLGHVDAPPTFVVVGCILSGSVGGRAVLAGHVVSAGGEDGLDQCGGGGGFTLVLHQMFKQQGRCTRCDGRRHAGALHVAVTAVVHPRSAWCTRGGGFGGQNEGPGCGNVGLDAVVIGGAPGRKRCHALGVVGQSVVGDGVDPAVRGAPNVGVVAAVVFRGADGQHVLGGSRGTERIQIDFTVVVGVGAFVGPGEQDDEFVVGAGAGVGLSRAGGVRTVFRSAPGVGVNPAPVVPCVGEHVIEVGGDPDQPLFAPIRHGDGLEQQVGFRGHTNNVAVAVGPVAQHRTGDVGAVTVGVLGVITARVTEAVIGARAARGLEGDDAGDVVAEIGVHVRVVDAVVKAGVGHGHDDAAAVQSGPAAVHRGHVTGFVQVVGFDDLASSAVHGLENRGGLDPLHFVLRRQPGEAGRFDEEGGEAPVVVVQRHVAAAVEVFRQFRASEHHVHQGHFGVHHGLRRSQAEQPFCQAGSHLVRRVHHPDAEHVELGQAFGSLPGKVTVEAGRGQEGVAVNAGLGEVLDPLAGHRVGVAEDVEAVQAGFTGELLPVARSHQGKVTVEQLADVRSCIAGQPPVGCIRRGDNSQVAQRIETGVGLGVQSLVVVSSGCGERQHHLGHHQSHHEQRGTCLAGQHGFSMTPYLIKDCIQGLSCERGRGFN